MTDNSQNTSGRAGRLTAFLRGMLNGQRSVKSAHDAKLFFEAIQSSTAVSSCMESLVASKCGLDALRLSLRVDQAVEFIISQILPFIGILQDDQLKLLVNGLILQKILVAIVHPTTLWNRLVLMARTKELEARQLRTVSWLCLELLSLPDHDELDVHDDIEALAKDSIFINASCPDTRQFGYKIDKQIQLLRSPPATSGNLHSPGGRHDNDFADFRKILIYPTTDEIICKDTPFYRRAKDVFEADMSERPALHLDNIYRLLREDILSELRSDLQNAQTREKGKSRCSLQLRKLDLVGIHTGDEKFRKRCGLAISCGMGLDKLEKVEPSMRKRWLNENKNYLRHRALGALYQGREIFGFAFVERDLDCLLLSPSVVTLQFTDEAALKKALMAFKMAKDVMFALVDTPMFAYEPVLRRLKDMTELPLQDRLLDPRGSADDFTPAAKIQAVAARLGQEEQVTVLQIGDISNRRKFELDHSQQLSLKSAITSSVSITQGPPGTGKSFIGALATHFILKYTKAKILVITYTNHALDQFLEDLMDLGIDTDGMVRLGSKSTSRTAHLALSTQRPKYRRGQDSWAMIDELKREAEGENQALWDAFNRYSEAQPSFYDFQNLLEFSEEYGGFYEAFLVPEDDDGFSIAGRNGAKVQPDYLFRLWASGKGPGMFERHIASEHKAIWKIAPAQRKELIGIWLKTIVQENVDSTSQCAERYDAILDQVETHFSANKVEVLREKRIIACTTTAAAMHSNLLSSAGVEVVLVEEAGEIQEAHVLTALTPTVKQLILIGDHQQLRPKTNNYLLTVEKGDGYDLNRSLFERLVLQGHSHTTLRKQHRMHPDISVLVRELTYPDLEDGSKTSDRDSIRGLEDRVIFVNHSHPEVQAGKLADRRDHGAKNSKENQYEADMVLKTVRFLAQQGHSTKEMVVLTPYLGQLRLIMNKLRSEVDPWLSDLDSCELIKAGLMTQAAASVGKSTLRISTIGEYSYDQNSRLQEVSNTSKTIIREKKQT